MNSAAIVRQLRRKLADVDPMAARFTDEDLWDALMDARIALKARKQEPFDTAVVVDDTVDENWVIGDVDFDPELDEAPALMLVVKAAADVLHQTLQQRLSDGSLGVSWRSGTEEESSITAGQEYAKLIQKYERELVILIGVANASKAGTRPQ